MTRKTVFEMPFGKVYACLVAKAERKNRTQQEVDHIINWLTGYPKETISDMASQDMDYKTFFANAPLMNPHRFKVTGSIYKVHIEDIEDPLMKEIRILDKMIDELAKGKPMERIIRN